MLLENNNFQEMPVLLNILPKLNYLHLAVNKITHILEGEEHISSHTCVSIRNKTIGFLWVVTKFSLDHLSFGIHLTHKESMIIFTWVLCSFLCFGAVGFQVHFQTPLLEESEALIKSF